MQNRQLSIFSDRELPDEFSVIDKDPSSSGLYIPVTDRIPIDLADGAFISIERGIPLKVYSLGFQPAKTIPEIPNWFIQKYTTRGEVIFDPFAGSGTSLIEALKLNRKVIWLDYHPLSQLICQVKTTRFSLKQTVEEYASITQDLELAKVPSSRVNFSNKDFWFQKPVQDGLEILKERIYLSREIYRPVFWLAFASTLRKCSDMNDGMILAARRSRVQDIPRRTKSDVFKYFNFYFEKIVEALAEWYRLDWDEYRVKQAESTDARRLEGDWSCDAIVTSPPYVNAIDYVWASKFELHWLDLVKNDKDRLDLYSREIGTERISSSEYKLIGKTGFEQIDRLIEDIFYGRNYRASKGQNELRARVVYQYFIDMKQHFTSAYEKLRDGGFYCFAVGDISKICGVNIPVADSLTNFAIAIGFEEIFRFHVLLKNRKLNIPRNVNWAGTIKHDTVIVMKKK